jgi:hypothetical protein
MIDRSSRTVRTQLLGFNGAVELDPAIDAWIKAHANELGAIAHQWFDVMRKCGDEVRELLPGGISRRRASRLNGRDINLFHRHHRVEGTLCLTATSRKRVREHARSNLPG